jgi:hypothetical protein
MNIKSLLLGAFLIAGTAFSTEGLDGTEGPDFFRRALIASDWSNNEKMTANCWCEGSCFYGTPDSYHFTKAVDVSCSWDLTTKKEKVVDALMSHYVTNHGINAIPRVMENVSIKCFRSSTN